MNQAVNVSKFVLLTLCVVLLVAVTLFGTPDFWIFGSDGVFEDGAVPLGLDLNGGSIITYEAEAKDGAEITAEGMADVEQVMRKRLDNLGYTEANVYLVGDNCVTIEIPGISDPTDAVETIGSTASLKFVDNDNNEFLDGEHVIAATPQYGVITEGGTEQYYVALEFDAYGARAFADATQRISALASSQANYISILLDDATISKASVTERIEGGRATISGSFDRDQVMELAALINGGSLPYELVCDGEKGSLSSVAPSLGETSLSRSLIAGGIGLILVMIFMIVMYKFPGVIASICLIAYAAIMGICLVGFKINLTLPGIAGIILGIGMAVDSNVVIFERIRELLKAGKTVPFAVEKGFSNALSAVVDSAITTLIASVVLWVLGSGSIQGFAITLFMSVIISAVTAIALTKLFLSISVKMNVTKLSAYGVKKESVK